MGDKSNKNASPNKEINLSSKKLLFDDNGVELNRYSVGNNDGNNGGIILILRLNCGPNVFNPTMTEYMNKALDIIEKDYSGDDHPNKCLIITGSDKNIFFEWIRFRILNQS